MKTDAPGAAGMSSDQAAAGEDFDDLSWHDDTLHGLSMFTGDIANDDWRSELVLDIDHIVKWIRTGDGRFVFDVAAATLTFHNATDLRLDLNWAPSGVQTALSPAHIDRIERQRIADQKICLDRPYYRWQIFCNWPQGGTIGFGATDYTLTLRGPVSRQPEQTLSSVNRPPLVG